MGRIKDEGLYPLKENISPDDTVPGTSTDENGKTVSYSFQGMLDFFNENLDFSGESGQDNVDIIAYVNTFDPQVIGSMSALATLVNSRATFTVSAIQSLWIFVWYTDSDANDYLYKYKIINIGKGTYGSGGTAFIPSNFVLISSKSLQIADLLFIATTQIVNYGDIGDEIPTVSEWLNQQDPFISIQPQPSGYTIFQGTINSVSTDYLFIGATGDYGGGGASQSTDDDFQLINSSGNNPGGDFIPLAGTGEDPSGFVSGKVIFKEGVQINMRNTANPEDDTKGLSISGDSLLSILTGSFFDTGTASNLPVEYGLDADGVGHGSFYSSLGSGSTLDTSTCGVGPGAQDSNPNRLNISRRIGVDFSKYTKVDIDTPTRNARVNFPAPARAGNFKLITTPIQDTRSTAHTLATLETAYPGAGAGQRVICLNMDPELIYEKGFNNNDPTDPYWFSVPITIVN